MIKNLVFDMGNVLVHDDMPAFARACAESDADGELLYAELMEGPEWKEWDRGTMNTDEMVASVNKRLPERLHANCAAIGAKWHMETQDVDGIEDLIRRAKAAGYGIYLLSNTADTYWLYREHLPAIDCFDGEYVSADHHLVKPYLEVYYDFCRRFRLSAEECWFTDDTRVNVLGAIAAGWQGFWFHKDVPALEAALNAAGVNF
ncbi:MAG: HAD-IA family hydrolase [Propionibacteriaceae bacterium]|jgi:putative hydrolase of the HAD superfamily|nr:HAD-IA family hydrolase [Propionibacteriaceae bacterium]